MDDSILPITRSEFKAKVQAHQAKLKLDFETARQALANSPSGPIDEDGYPTQEALNVVSTWHDPEYSRESLKLLFEFMYSLWHLKSWGWSESIVNHEFREGIRVLQFNISTAGWSGNESIIKALEQNQWAWHQTWVQSRRGGHFIFEIIL